MVSSPPPLPPAAAAHPVLTNRSAPLFPWMQVMAQKTKEAEITEQDSLLLTRNLLRIAIYNISYIRGLFPEKYFNDKSVPALEMKIKKLMPMDPESRRLIDWMEKVSFSYPSKGEEVSMNLSRTGSKKNNATFKSNAEEVTPDQMRSSACKMIRTLVSLMRTLDQMPDERTILMKLLYYDDVTVKIVLDPCDANNVNSEDDNMSLGHESVQDDDSDTEVRPSEVDRYVVAPNEDTQDPAHEEAITAQVREWICSRDIINVHASDVLSNFPDISMEMVEDILGKLFKDGLLSRASKDSYAVNKITDPETPHIKKEVLVENVSPPEGIKSNNVDTMYMKALYHALPMDYVTVAKLQGKLDGEANQNTVRKLIDKMVQDGYVKNSGNRRLGKAVIHSEASNRKLLEIKRILEVDLAEELATDTNPGAAEFEHRDHPMTDQEMKDGSTNGCFHSVGSDLTRTRELPEIEQNVSMQKDPSRTPTSMREPATSLESGVLGQRIKKSMTGGDASQSTQHGKRTRKASMAKEPILQFVKRQKAPVQ
ncbi:hypothetical protein ACQ4PT_057174 [Festuca glaucescens]